MMRKFLTSLTVVTAGVSIVAAAQAQAQTPGNADPAAIQAGAYSVEPDHTQVGFSVLHMGFTRYDGVFSNVSGQLKLDPKTLEATSLEVTMPVDSVRTTSAKLDGELKGDQWLNAAKYPTMHFRSTKITKTGPNTATVDGELTLHGVTKPVALRAKFVGAGVNPLDRSYTAGFFVTGVIKRSDFGVTTYVPMVSDEVGLTINAAFHKAP
jgi:polyisoprenoid-binding protein YceI